MRWPCASGRELGRFRADKAEINTLGFSADDKYLVTLDSTGELRLLEVPGNQVSN